MRIFIALALPFLFSCSHWPHPQPHRQLFPQGHYQHVMDVSITGTRQAYQFNGVVGLSPEALKMYMMGPMDVTVMKISETYADRRLQIENYFEPLKPYESSISRFYPILRSLLLFPKEESQWGALTVLERSSDGSIVRFKGPHGIEIHIKEYKNNHPVRFEIRHPRFVAAIKEIS